MDLRLDLANIKHKYDFLKTISSDKLERKFFISLIFIVAIGFIIRFTLLFKNGVLWFSTDTYDYMTMADAIISGHPIAKFPNGFPLLIALIKIFFQSEKLPFVLVFLNVCLSTIVIGMTAAITIKITKKKYLGVVAALIVALYPNQINYTHQILSEVPTCFLLTLSIFIYLKKNYFVSGLILFAATMFRSDLLLVFPMLFSLTLFYFYKNDKITNAVYYLAGYLAGVIFYSMLLSYSIVSSTNRYGLEILKSLNANSIREEYPSIKNFSADEQAHPIRTYFSFMINHPTTYIQQRLSAAENMWGLISAPSRSLSAQILIAIRFPIFILGLFGLWKYRSKFEAWIIAMPIIALSIIHIALYSSPRYTYSVEPLLICLASMSLIRRPDTHESHRPKH